ncbi:N-methylhydantoinase A [Palleronia aestuarii]|uniref:N-methylhydantoinase A n=1 Tax=Palleronia aestuarii TaxID=568105 RepID=A0A2W7MXZ4_9RHOB|nr:hydantoinase/oxoprolinase family protein [Palleronia aestuarii]PZX13025.1 N-methylhydantoinase A [Palleronia aestuarii]
MADVVGIDVGGTFTDLFYSEDGINPHRILKVPSTPHDPSEGLLDALDRLHETGVRKEALGLILHGTTIATNAVIERVGARCALVTTKGFRDVLELGRRDRPHFYGLTDKQNPLIARNLRFEIGERMTHRGEVQKAVDGEEVRRLAKHLKKLNIEAVVVSYLHSYANAGHEEETARILREVNPDWEIVVSSAINREYYEFERTSTAAIQAFLQPLIKQYASRLLERLEKWGFDRRTLVMQSNGGLTPAERLGDKAAHIVRSGPAAGVTAAARIAAEAGFDRAITGDMGGTSFDVAVVIDGEPEITPSTNLDFRMPLRVSMINVHTIGAGGGSIASIDRAGLLVVGPRSARARPGPACFGHGGTEPTVTDANVVLSRINAEDPIGLTNLDRLDVEAARAAIGSLGEKLGLGVEETAEAILTVVNQNMAGRTRLLSIERGYDPRDFALVIFGGAGPLHGAAIIREVGIKTMIVPPAPGVLCAMGCVVADLRYDISRTLARPTQEITADALAAHLDAQEAEGRGQLEESGVTVRSVLVRHFAEMAYKGQIHTLRVPVERGWGPEKVDAAFAKAYRSEFGNLLDGIPTAIVSLRTVVEGQRNRDHRDLPAPAEKSALEPAGHRPVYFGGWHDSAIYDRETFEPGVVVHGPCIVEQADTTIVIEPGMIGRVDAYDNILVEIA